MTRFKVAIAAFISTCWLSGVSNADIRQTSSGTGSPSVYKLSDVGGVNGGGGGTPCAEFTDLFSTFATSLQQAVINAKFKVSNAFDMIETIEDLNEKFRCLPAERLDRDARSNSITITTRLLIPAWKTKNQSEKLRLVAHEFCIMTGLEREGEYQVSERLLQILAETSPQLKNSQRAEKVVANRDGSVTLLKPFILDEKNVARGIYIESTKDKRATSLCRFFEMNQALEVWSAPADGPLAVMDARGAGALSTFRDMSEMSRSVQKIESITCK